MNLYITVIITLNLKNLRLHLFLLMRLQICFISWYLL